MAFRPTLNQVFAASVGGLFVLLAVLFQILHHGSRSSALEFARTLRGEKSAAVSTRVGAFLNQAEDSLTDFEDRVQSSALDARDIASVEAHFFAELRAHDDLEELCFTYSEMSPGPQRQINVFRIGNDEDRSRLITRVVKQSGDALAVEERQRKAGDAFNAVPFQPTQAALTQAPTQELTYVGAVRSSGATVWSDLHYSERDFALPEERRRVVLTVQKTVEDAGGRLLGVVRAGLLTKNLNRVVQSGLEDDRDHRIFICDRAGRLITGLQPNDPIKAVPGDDLRVVPARMSDEIRAALDMPDLKRASTEDDSGGEKRAEQADGRFELSNEPYLYTFTPLNNRRDWILGIVVPEAAYLRALEPLRRNMLIGAVIVMLCILAGGLLTIRMVRGDLQEVVRETSRMEQFEFTPAPVEASVADIRSVRESLESAKTAVRAMGKYVPMSLVRQLYQRRSEPVLGSTQHDVTIMFSDIKDFTAVSERLGGDQLAQALGLYLQAMTAGVHASRGTIDKFIGDAVMALWNVPDPVDAHALRACRAALDCVRRAQALFESPQWKGLNPWHTRFGIHTDAVMVGHFGAPERMSYTAMGDGVNTASRLEGLNKFYGTAIIASEAVVQQAQGEFVFRVLDVVAVKGKTKGLRVYELVGPKGEQSSKQPLIAAYEAAFEAYLKRDFKRALELLAPQIGRDAPSRVLTTRCEEMLEHPPPPEWNGVYVAKSK